MKHTGLGRSTAIFPITIETPYGTVLLAYRVQDGKVLGRPFPVMADVGPTLPAASEFWHSLVLDETISDIWWASLSDAEKAELECDCPGVLSLTEKGANGLA